MPANTTSNPALKRITVAPIANSDAKRIVLARHYMRTFPQGAKLSFGVYDGDKVVGVCVFGFSTATTAKVERLVPTIKAGEYLEMQRLWISDAYGHNTESFVFGRIMRQIRQHTGVKLIVTHAGGCKNDCGIVYQASAWLYFGREECRDFYLTEAGEYKNVIAALRFGRAKGKPEEVGREMFGPGHLIESYRYLYAYPIDKGLRRKLTRCSLPYPKESAVYRYAQEWVDGSVGPPPGSNPDDPTNPGQ